MTSDSSTLQHRRQQILQEMGAIDRLQRGHLSQQFFQSVRQGKTIRQGPYYVLQRWFQGKNLCERIPAEQVQPVRLAVEGYQRFRRLAEEFVELSEQLTRQAGLLPEVKKKSRRRSNKSSSEKPTRF
jgi:hypothetical protein